MSVTVVPNLDGRLLQHRIPKLVARYEVSIPEANMIKNSSTLAVPVPINLSTKLGFVSINGPRETYFMDLTLSSLA